MPSPSRLEEGSSNTNTFGPMAHALVQAMRELWGNAPALGADAALPLRHPVLASVLWSVGLSLILAPLAIRAFRNRTEKA